jgi:hypothetical protein
MNRGAAIFLACLLSAASASAKVLITEEEASQPADPFAPKGLFPGPKITLVSPHSETAGVKSPIHLKITFEPRGANVIPTSLKVTYLKFHPVDLTERVRAFASQNGIDMPEAEVPPGLHKIRIQITDSDGLSGQADFVLNISK